VFTPNTEIFSLEFQNAKSGSGAYVSIGFWMVKVAGVRNGFVGTGLWKYVDKHFASGV